MFGYVKLDATAPKELKKCFKKNYCVLCHSLGKYYGQKARIIVSFDVTFFQIIFTEDFKLAQINKKINCFRKSKELKGVISEDYFKKIAALNLLLARGQVEDNISDDDGGSLKAKVGNFLYKRTFKKAAKDYPNLWVLIDEGHKNMTEVEKRNGSIGEVEEAFAAMIEKVARDEFYIEDIRKISYLVYAAKMLYFMDAVDDLDKDIITGSYNGLKMYESRRNYIANHKEEFLKHINSIKAGVMALDNDSINNKTASRIVFRGMPDKLYRIATKGVKL